MGFLQHWVRRCPQCLKLNVAGRTFCRIMDLRENEATIRSSEEAAEKK